jgi:hypothetical protein
MDRDRAAFGLGAACDGNPQDKRHKYQTGEFHPVPPPNGGHYRVILVTVAMPLWVAERLS